MQVGERHDLADQEPARLRALEEVTGVRGARLGRNPEKKRVDTFRQASTIQTAAAMDDNSHFDFRIDSIRLTNFRPFAAMELRLDSQMTALTAPNGGGKSAALQALAIACAHFVHSLYVHPGIPNGFRESDRRCLGRQRSGDGEQGDTALVCFGHVGDEDIEWKLELPHAKSRTRLEGAAALARQATSLRERSAASDRGEAPYVFAPVLAFYDTRRLAHERRLTANKRSNKADRFDGYIDCLAPGSSIRIFKDWFQRMSGQRFQEIADGEEDEGSLTARQLGIVYAAIDQALDFAGWGKARWNFKLGDVTLTAKDGTVLALDQLGDGVQNVFCLVADIAHRAVRLNPCADADLLQHVRGLVLIDEVDLYLHPGWQQCIVRTLMSIFPKIQFVVSTHSPQVLSTLKKKQIRVFTEGNEGCWYAREPEVSPYAHSAEKALAAVLGTPPSPKVPEMDDLHRLERLYRQGSFAEADKLREELADKGVEVDDGLIVFWKRIASIRSTSHA